jgi:hypothetical protein
MLNAACMHRSIPHAAGASPKAGHGAHFEKTVFIG